MAGLTNAEKRCCHFQHWLGSPPETLPEWRKEFAEIERSEHCRDCPVLKTQPR